VLGFWRAGTRTPAWWVAAALGSALYALDLIGQLRDGIVQGSSVLYFVAMAVALAAGLWVWAWRPQTRMGPLIFWWPALSLAADLVVPYPSSRLVTTGGLGLYLMGPIVYAQMTLSYPNGRLQGRLAVIYIYVLAYAAQVVQNIYNLLYYDGRSCAPYCVPQQRSWLYVGSPPWSLDWWNRGWSIEIMAILPIGLGLVWWKLYRSPPGARRTFLPLALALTVGTVVSFILSYLTATGNIEAIASATSLFWILHAGSLAGALAVFVGLAITRRARGPVGELVVELGRAGPGGIRDALARAIGDPSLELALWLPDRRVWVDEQGREVVLPDGRDRAVTYVGVDLAALVHDPVFLDQPALLEAVGSAARLALENERLHAELRAQLAEIRESRARIVKAGDEERRRLERDLHDGAQQRLLAIGMALQLLRPSADDETRRLLDETRQEVEAALAELRELARGIHPAVLTNEGLGAAIRTLADRSPVPVEVSAPDERLPAEVETAAYFIVAEALANVAKHAHASKAWVDVHRRNGAVRVEVRDDGVGGAGAAEGSGLRGLADRAGALDGRVEVDSPPGGGTSVTAEIPCGL
jgi:signal transduction histidine kinase